MARKVKYLFPNLINSTNVDEWTAAYLNYAMKASVNNSAITDRNPNARRDLDAKMSQLALDHTPNLSAWSVQAFADKIRQVFSLSGSDADVIYSFLAEEFFIWKYGFNINFFNRNKAHFVNKFGNNKSSLFNVFDNIFSTAKKSGLKTGADKSSLISILASDLSGVSLSGASALLSLIFPDHIGTCDSVFLKQYNLDKQTTYRLYKTSIAIFEGYMVNQSTILNKLSGSNFWTPRKIDQAVWANRI